MRPIRQIDSLGIQSYGSSTGKNPHGVESTLDYNGYLFNDRRKLDWVYVKSISGLEDADVRDTREVIEGRHGETAFEPHYSGRTISIRGFLEAGNINKLRDIEAEFKGAFSKLTEKPLRMRWNDWYDDFTLTGALGDYTNIAGMTTIVPSSTGLTPTDTATTKQFFYPHRAYEEPISVTKFTTTNLLSGLFKTVENYLKYLTSNTYIQIGIRPNSLTVNIVTSGSSSVTGGTISTPISASGNFTLATGLYYDDSLTSYRAIGVLWEGDPDVDLEVHHLLEIDKGIIASNYLTKFGRTLSGPENTTFGAGVAGKSGISWVPNTTTERITSVDFGAYGVSDTRINCRKIAKLEIEDTQATDRFRREYLLTLRASDDRLLSRFPDTKFCVVAAAYLAFPGSGGLTFPSDGTGFAFGDTLTTIRNEGSHPTWLKVVLKGYHVNPSVNNTTTGEVVGLVGTGTSFTYTIDSATQEVYSTSDGVNAYSIVDDNHTWVSLDPGDNVISYAADDYNSTTDVLLVWNHAW